MPAFATVHEPCAHGRLSEPFLVSKAAILLASATGRDLWQWSKGQCIQLFRESLSQKMCTRQNRKVIWDMIHCYRDCSCRTYFCCFPLALANISPWTLVPFFEISSKNSEIKNTHNTFRDCRVHFFRQPFSK